MSVAGAFRGLGSGLQGLSQTIISQHLAERERQKREEAWNARFNMQQEAADKRIESERAYQNEPVSIVPGIGAVSGLPGGNMLPDFKLPRSMAGRVQGAVADNVLRQMFTAPEPEYDPESDPELLLHEALRGRGLYPYHKQGEVAPAQVPAADAAAEEPMSVLDEGRAVDLFGAYVGGDPGRSALREAGAVGDYRSMFRDLIGGGMNPAAAADSVFSGVAGAGELPEGYTYYPVLDRYDMPLKDADGNIRYGLHKIGEDDRNWFQRRFGGPAEEVYEPIDDPEEVIRTIMRKQRGQAVQPEADAASTGTFTLSDGNILSAEGGMYVVTNPNTGERFRASTEDLAEAGVN